MSKIPKPKSSSMQIVQPSIIFEGGKEHAMVTLFKGDEEKLPTIKSVGYMQVPGTTQFVAYTLTSKGTEVLKIEVEEPNIRAIAEESAKISFVQSFIDVGSFSQDN
jgi:hypothetical protein